MRRVIVFCGLVVGLALTVPAGADVLDQYLCRSPGSLSGCSGPKYAFPLIPLPSPAFELAAPEFRTINEELKRCCLADVLERLEGYHVVRHFAVSARYRNTTRRAK